MIVVGISHPISRNNAACIIVDGALVAMAEEERFIRVKHAPRIFPQNALDFCLRQAGVQPKHVDFVAVGHDRPLSSLRNLRLAEPVIGLWQTRKQFLDLKRSEEKLVPVYRDYDPKKIVFVRHHLAHAASAFFASGFEKSNILTLDGSGDSESGILAVGSGISIKILRTMSNPTSLGKAYEYVTEVLGFKYNSEEGKTMGLAAYGTPDLTKVPFFDWDVEIPRINHRKRTSFFREMKPRDRNQPLTQEHRDLAASMQYGLELATQRMVEWLHRQTGIRNLCLAGGTAMNCSMNGKLVLLPCVDEIFVQPAAHDAGSALGAALYVYTQKTGENPLWRMQHAYWGEEYTNEQIFDALRRYKSVSAHLSADICSEAAALLAEGNVVGWFQGRFEVGARALGNRSILGDPSRPDMKDLINMKVKNREIWRPFAPSILEEEIGRYVASSPSSPFMILAFDAFEETRSEIISAVHVDGSTRPQTVSKATNPKYWTLIKRFSDITGIPAILNTSFNVASQPIVNSPIEAIDTYINCGMDYLVIGDYVVSKTCNGR